MKVIVAKDYDDMSRRAASIIAGVMLSKDYCVLGLATGSSPLGTYRELVRLNEEGVIDFSDVTTYNLDEYYKISEESKHSYHYFMHDNLFDHINILPDSSYFPDAQTDDPDYGREYDAKIREDGGIDLQLLGLGHDGHIGFNEPQEDFPVYTHRVMLNQCTIEANKRFFSSAEDVPREAVTMGIGTIMRSRQVLMIVSGKDKAAIVKQMLDGPVIPECPASILRFHQNCTIILDEEAASLLDG